MIYFTSDEHHFDQHIISYCKRPFNSHTECTKAIIENHNKLVNEEDVVVHLGDFSFDCEQHDLKCDDVANILKQYKKVKERILILGNHDNFSRKEYLDVIGFDKVADYLTIEYKGEEIFLCHDPAFYQPGIYHKIALCGHVHNLFTTIPKRNIYNVAVDANYFSLIEIDKILHQIKVSRIS